MAAINFPLSPSVDDTTVFIHDFNREDYQKVLKYYEPVEILTEGQGIAALRKRTHIIHDNSYY
jgi:hypothetical protein